MIFGLGGGSRILGSRLCYFCRYSSQEDFVGGLTKAKGFCTAPGTLTIEQRASITSVTVAITSVMQTKWYRLPCFHVHTVSQRCRSGKPNGHIRVPDA
jgi:hypothetical protein